MNLTYTSTQENISETINDVLINEFDLSNRLRTKLIRNNLITLNNNIVDTRTSIKKGDTIKIDLSFSENNSNIVPTQMDLDILYEDEWFIVVNKPAHIAVHPSNLHYNDSLSNGIKYYFDKIGLQKKIRPVNRLDLNTSGIVIFAKCEYIHKQFSKQMLNNTFKKEYLCIVSGKLSESSGTINLPIARKCNRIIERCIDLEKGKNSITHFKVLNVFDNYSLIKCILETGRTHQIRVHLSAIGHPLLGDSLYGQESNLIKRQALHSCKIELFHPVFKKTMVFECDLPSDMKNLLK